MEGKPAATWHGVGARGSTPRLSDLPGLARHPGMNDLARFWGERSAAEKTALALAALATGGAAAYAVATYGAVVVVGGTTVAVGKAAVELAKRV